LENTARFRSDQAPGVASPSFQRTPGSILTLAFVVTAKHSPG